MATPSKWAALRIERLNQQPAPTGSVDEFIPTGPRFTAPTLQQAQEAEAMFYQGFTSAPSGTIGSTAPSGFSLGGLITTTAGALTGALAERIAGGQVTQPSAQQVADLKAAGFGMVPAEFLTTAAPLQSNGSCGCQPRPGKCEPQYIDRDFGAFGANPCSADPRYPRPTTFQGQPVCGPARKKPRMNPLNPRAAGRAARRLAAAGRAMKRIKRSVQKAERQLR